MNEDDALRYFSAKGRKPSYDSRGRVRGFRSRPGAPQANTQDGIAGASNAMSAVDWVRTFNTTGAQMRGSALEELGITESPSTTGAAGPVGDGGIAAQTIDAAFGRGYWNRLMTRGPAPSQAPSLYSPAPFMPRDPSTPFTVPKPLTGPMGNDASDRANLAANMAMYAPGGAQGFWGARAGAARPPEKWQGPTTANTKAASFVSRFGTASVNFDKRLNAGYGWGGNRRAV